MKYLEYPYGTTEDKRKLYANWGRLWQKPFLYYRVTREGNDRYSAKAIKAILHELEMQRQKVATGLTPGDNKTYNVLCNLVGLLFFMLYEYSDLDSEQSE